MFHCLEIMTEIDVVLKRLRYILNVSMLRSFAFSNSVACNGILTVGA